MFAEWARSGRAVVHRRTSRTAPSQGLRDSLSGRGSTLAPGRVKKIRFFNVNRSMLALATRHRPPQPHHDPAQHHHSL
jgi:hypothetical protein